MKRRFIRDPSFDYERFRNFSMFSRFVSIILLIVLALQLIFLFSFFYSIFRKTGKIQG
jgi:hypothetical protein